MKTKNKVIASITCAAIAAGLISGCSATDEKTADAKWTVMMYLCGTDLESEGGAATQNLEEILQSNLSDNVNYIIQTGGTTTWQNDSISDGKVQRFSVSDGELVQLESPKNTSMGDPSALSDFISWAKENYSAEKYVLTFWNHGGGSVGGVCYDELHDNDSITVDELKTALDDSDVNFEMIGFDTCLMATLETAESVQNHAKYMVASEEYEPGGGWNYTEWLNYLSDNIDASGSDIGTSICDSYYEKCKTNQNESMATLSVIDLSKISAVTDSFTGMASKMTNTTEDIETFNNFARAATKAENYGGNTDNEGYTNMVDLSDLAAKTKSVIGEDCNSVQNAVTDAVVYNVNGDNRKNANGFSVFYPLGVTNEVLDSYAKVSKNATYLSFIDGVFDTWNAPDWVYENTEKTDSAITESNVNIKLSVDKNKNGYYELKSDKGTEYIQDVSFELYYMDTGSDTYVRLGSDNDIEADWDKGVFTDNFRGVWMTIGDCYVAPELVSQEESYNIYSIPVLLNGEQTNLRAVYDYDKEEFSILGAYDGIEDNGMSSRNIRKLKKGDKLVFLFDIEDTNGNSDTVEMGELTYDDSCKLEESDLSDGNYLYRFVVTDIKGNAHYSDPVEIEYRDGEIYT